MDTATVTSMEAMLTVRIVIKLGLLAVLVELINWLIVYRTRDYKNLITDVVATNKQMATLEAESRGKASSKDDKRRKKLEDALTLHGTKMYFMRMKTMFVNLVILGTMWRMLSSQYKGVAVARLPFQPPALIQRMSHMGLPGTDPHDCSVNFIFMLVSAGLRANVVKAFGFGLSRELQKATNPMARIADKAKAGADAK